MKTPAQLGLFGFGLVAVFAVAWGAGTLAGPIAAPSEGDAAHGGGHEEPAGSPVKIPGGLQVAQDGYRLELTTPTLSTVDAQPFTFKVIGPDGKPVTAYTTAHEKDLHLIVVRRDLSGFQHVHPALGPDGLWSVPLKVAEPGVYRVFADFVPAGRAEGLILGADVNVPGDFRPRAVPVGVVDDYTVTLEGDLVPGTSSKLTLTVSKGGKPVTDLQPYLGAFGHLVALRHGDLAYLHVHPDEGTKAGPQIVFYAEVPSAGTYGLYLDFQHEGTVRTVSFTATTAGVVTPPTPTPTPSKDGHGHGH
ncbi:hypothetical protein [Allorhizocola rhizosphaerae]|uniref:hypothetical protein n=1 Tax=Allorhizocola rhizosphaerae TaxID=1872709 RepID=UPI000E3BFF63|nr:hypothetical protein [Allorhizocola rhizosphaerae]